MIQPVVKTVAAEAQTWLCRQLDRLFYTIENLFRPMTDQFDFDFEQSQATPVRGACDAGAGSAAADAPPPNVTAADPPTRKDFIQYWERPWVGGWSATSMTGVASDKPDPVSAADIIIAHQIAAIDNINEPICYCNSRFRTRRAWAQHVIEQLRNTPR